MATTPKKTDADDAKKTDKAEKADKAQKIEPNPVEAGDPYPAGKGRDPEADFEAAHGYRRDRQKE